MAARLGSPPNDRIIAPRRIDSRLARDSPVSFLGKGEELLPDKGGFGGEGFFAPRNCGEGACEVVMEHLGYFAALCGVGPETEGGGRGDV